MVTWVPEVNSCCYFISLRTGAKLCGFIAVVGCLFLAISSSLEVMFVLRHLDQDDYQKLAWELGLEIAVQLIHMATSCSMIVGVYQEQVSLVRPWLITAILMAVLEIFFTESIFSRLYGLHVLYRPLSLQWILFTAFMLVDDIYGWLIVFSYYRSINTGARIA